MLSGVDGMAEWHKITNFVFYSVNKEILQTTLILSKIVIITYGFTKRKTKLSVEICDILIIYSQHIIFFIMFFLFLRLR